MFAIAGCVTLPANWKSGDVIAIGSLEDQTYESLGLPDDMLGHGTITAQFRVKRMVKGVLPHRVITVQYVANAEYSEDETHIRFHLRRSEDGTRYLVCKPKGQITGINC